MSGQLSRAVVVASVLVSLGVARTASAQEQAAPAQSLFEDGRALLAQKKYAEACAKLAESEKLDPAVGTLLNLGECYEKMGKIATAWSVFKDAAAMAHTGRQQSREKLATGRAEALQPHIPRLAIHAGQPPTGLEVRRDGVLVGQAEWAGASPSAVTVDPGEHDVVAVAKGRKPWFAKVTLAADGATTSVEVPELEPDELADRAPVNPVPASTVAVEAVNTHDRNVQRAIGVTIGALGVVSAIVAIPFGAIAISTNNSAKRECPTNTTCSQQGASDAAAAVRDGLISTVLVGVGVGVVVGGTVVFFTAPSATHKPASALRLSPTLTTRGGGLSLGGAF